MHTNPHKTLGHTPNNTNLAIIYKRTQTQDSKSNVHHTLTNYQMITTQLHHTMPIYYHTHLILLQVMKLNVRTLLQNLRYLFQATF